MGFLDKFRKKNEDNRSTDTQISAKDDDATQPSTTGRRIKKYLFDGKPLYE
jgi:hypothetical protein